MLSFVINSIDAATFAAVCGPIARATAGVPHEPGVRPSAVLVAWRWDARRARSETPLARDVPTRNGACPCGSGRRFKECHGGFGAGGRA